MYKIEAIVFDVVAAGTLLNLWGVSILTLYASSVYYALYLPFYLVIERWQARWINSQCVIICSL